ncbi:endonuclease III [Candidatus Sumerlaeota bacterium]|nr:endonuclease III [Candidatus Sumerlaeota bacterium]
MKQEIATRKPKAADVERAGKIAAILRREFPDAKCALNFQSPFQLLIATILSAQCTDERVNKVTPALFKKYKTPKAFATSPEGELEQDIRTTGFFNAKAKSIRACCQTLIDNFGGHVPDRIDDLITLRGAARKTSNVVRMHGFGYPGLSVDTHFTRVTHRLKLTRELDPEKIEFDVAALLPPYEWTAFSSGVIFHGRKTCHARNPKCDTCPIQKLCPSAFKAQGNPRRG